MRLEESAGSSALSVCLVMFGLTAGCAAGEKGQYYQATVPDTLDLAERAGFAINGLTGCLNPRRRYELYFVVRFDSNPPFMYHEHTGIINNPKFAEAMPKMRVMRLLIYEAEPERMAKQLGSSLPDGVKIVAGMSITAVTLGEVPNTLSLRLKTPMPKLKELILEFEDIGFSPDSPRPTAVTVTVRNQREPV